VTNLFPATTWQDVVAFPPAEMSPADTLAYRRRIAHLESSPATSRSANGAKMALCRIFCTVMAASGVMARVRIPSNKGSHLELERLGQFDRGVRR
jgi:hypothetical protein